MAQESPPPRPPSCRIKRAVIDGYRTITEPLTLDFVGGYDVIHGPNASGKTTALRALWVFFEAARLLATGGGEGVDLTPEIFERRDFPVGRQLSSSIRVWFDDGLEVAIEINSFRDVPRAALLPATDLGARAEHELAQRRTLRQPGSLDPAALRLLKSELNLEDRARLIPALGARLGGPGMRAFGIIQADRRTTWAARGDIPPEEQLGGDLLALGKSKVTEERGRFRAFVEGAKAFPLFQNRLITVEPEIVVERVGYSVLGISELSSGERQVLLLVGQLLAGGPRVVAILEPELSLDQRSMDLLRRFLFDLVSEGQLDQVLLESHSPAFDGPSVIQLGRSDTGAPTAARVAPAKSEQDAEVEKGARAAGAEMMWITREGWTRLPGTMVADLGVPEGGGAAWFLRGKGGWAPYRMDDDEAAPDEATED